MSEKQEEGQAVRTEGGERSWSGEKIASGQVLPLALSENL